MADNIGQIGDGAIELGADAYSSGMFGGR